MAPFFPLGRVVATPGAIAVMEAAQIDPVQLLRRHQSGDWGDLARRTGARTTTRLAGCDGSSRPTGSRQIGSG
jgi:hypothetical protein